MQVILVKHAKPIINPDQDAKLWSLSPEGLAKAAALADRLHIFKPTGILHSTERKAAQTANAISTRLPVSCDSVDGIHEHDRTGSPFLDTDAFDRAIRDLFSHPEGRIFGNESGDEACARFSSALNGILGTSCQTCPVVVAHGTVISLWLARYCGLDGYDTWRQLSMPSAVVVHRTTDWTFQELLPA